MSNTEQYYLFCHQFANFPLRAIFLPVNLLPQSVKNDFNELYNKYGSYFNIVDDGTDTNTIKFFELLADGSPGSYDMAFNYNSFENMEIETPDYVKDSIFYYDYYYNRKDFNIPLRKDMNSLDLYGLLKQKYNVVKSIFYEQV